MANEWEPEDIYEVLSDERTRQILAATNLEERSVKDLSKVCDGSQSSIYRRIDVLTDYDLLEEENRLDPEGHHYSVYKPGFKDIRIYLEDQDVVTEIEYTGGAELYEENWSFTD